MPKIHIAIELNKHQIIIAYTTLIIAINSKQGCQILAIFSSH